MLFTRGQAIEFIEKVFGPSKPSNAGLNISVLCPICEKRDGEKFKRKLVIRTDDFRSHCWVCNDPKTKNIHRLVFDKSPELAKQFVAAFGARRKHGSSGGARCLNILMEGEEGHEEWLVEPAKSEVVLPKGFTFLGEWLDKPFKPLPVYQAMQYLESRGVTRKDYWFFKYGITEDDPRFLRRIVVPSHDADGELNFYTSRAYTKRYVGMKYYNPTFEKEQIVFNELNIDWSDELTLVEGPFDLVKANENAVPLLGSTLDETYKLFQRIVHYETPVVIALDNDAKRKTYKLAKLFHEYGIRVKIADIPKEHNDVGELSRETFKEILSRAKIMDSMALLHYKLYNT